MTIKNVPKIVNGTTAEGKQWPQIMCICVVALGCITIGIMWSWTSPSSVRLVADKVNYNISETDTANFLILQPAGMIATSIFAFKLTQIIGSKKSVWLMGLPYLAAWIMIVSSRTKWFFYLSRLIAGIGDGIFFCAGPPYIGEITTPTVRGYFGFLPIFSVFFGGFIITVLGSYLDIVTTGYICMVPCVLFLILMYFIPESPSQFIKEGKIDEAKHTLQWLRRKTDIEEDFEELKVGIDRQLSEGSTFKDLFTIKANRRALRAGLLLRIGQQLSGVTVFSNYTQMIFQKAGTDLSPQMSSIIFTGLAALLNVASSSGIERLGRRFAFVTSVLSCGIILVLMSVYFFFDQYSGLDLINFKWVPLAGMLTYIVVFAPGLGIVPTLMLGELFSVTAKYKGLTVLTVGFGVAVFVVSLVFNLLNQYVGLAGPFLVYGLCCFVSGFLGWFWVPETKGKTLEEIQLYLAK